MKSSFHRTFLIAVVLLAALAACGDGGDESASPKAAASTSSETSAKAPATIPEIELPEGASQDAQKVVEINQIIAEVTQEAINRPKDQRMSSEEISQLIRTRFEEVSVRP